MAVKPYAPEVRAACLAALLEGQTLASVQAKTGVSRRTLLVWKAEAKMAPAASELQRKEIGELVVESLRRGLTAMSVLQAQFSDPEWVRKFSPAELATAFGIISDKSVRVLEAMVPAESGDES